MPSCASTAPNGSRDRRQRRSRRRSIRARPRTEYGHNTDSFISFRAPTAGTYYFSVESLRPPGRRETARPSAPTQLNVSIGPPATAAAADQRGYRGADQRLANGRRTNLTYGFPNAGQPISAEHPGNRRDRAGHFAPFSARAAERGAAMLQLHLARSPRSPSSSVADPGRDADLRYAMSDEAEVAYAYYPPAMAIPAARRHAPGSTRTGFRQSGASAITPGWASSTRPATRSASSTATKPRRSAPTATALEYTVMTYRSYPGPGRRGGGGYTNETWGYPQSLMMYDIAALQRIYGANFAYQQRQHGLHAGARPPARC